jgi:hypothetical protein
LLTVPKISIRRSPIANLEHPFAISLINSFSTQGIAIDSAKGCSKLAIGDRRMLIFGLHFSNQLTFSA